MTLRLDQFDVMEYLWETLPKTEDGRLHYGEGDIEQLYWLGFVDATTFTMEEWKAAVEPQRQPDETYLFNREEFMALDQYRYKGEIRIPFAAMEINEGKYTDEGFDDLVKASIAPSCNLPLAELTQFMNQLKKDFRQGDGLILIKQPAKQRIKTLIESKPSPLHNLERLLENMTQNELDRLDAEIGQAHEARAELQAEQQKSTFSSTPTTRLEAKALGLKALMQARQKEQAASTDDKGQKVELKKIRRSPKGMRG